MYRRIEVLSEPAQGMHEFRGEDWCKGVYTRGIGGVWRMLGRLYPWPDLDFGTLKAPEAYGLGTRNVRYYFTEAGWDEYGRDMVVALKKVSSRFRILSIKERSQEVVYEDRWQVAVRPLKRRYTSARQSVQHDSP